MKLHITEHRDGKMAGLRSISTDSLSNPFCSRMAQHSEFVCSHCYARRLEGFRASLMAKLVSNTKILTSRKLEKSEIPKIHDKYFRFDSFGELANLTQLENYISIAEANPETTFALWTKRSGLVESMGPKIPKNLVLVYSEPLVNPSEAMKNAWDYFLDCGFDWIFAVTTDPTKVNCPRKCIECLRCYRKPQLGESRIVWELLRK
ncbi:TPA_asm: hypothetical protein vir526_00018 [Caudoviricetes sp. vir526]|nr:TPA_asm: hypothetical protein vir526_00018 [Caudoviricetes sp. vir526]